MKGTKNALIAVLGVACLALGGVVQADVPLTISHQGQLTDENGLPVADDLYQLTVRLYDVPSGGGALWSETHTIQTTDGLFHVVLGSQSALDLPFDEPYWLGMSIEGGAELVPRVQVTSSPYALRAAVADVGADADWVINGDDMHAAVPGKVGVGTDSPDAKLEAHADSGPGITGRHTPTGNFGSLGTSLAGIYGLGQSGYGAWFDGDVFVNAMLEVDDDADIGGTLRMSGLQLTTSPSPGYVLTSDAAGNGTWQPGAAGQDDDWTIVGDDMYAGVPGNVGIGTTGPNGPLHVESDLNINDGSNFADRIGALVVGDGDGTGRALLFDGNQIEQAAGGSENIYLNYNSSANISMVMGGGDVGIGTHSPDERLDVIGNVRAQGIQITTAPEVGYVLTSDAEGFGSWHPPGPLTLPFEDAVTENGGSAFRITNAGAGGGTVAIHGAGGIYPATGVLGEVNSGWGVYGKSPSAYGFLGGLSTGAFGKDTSTEHTGSLGTNDHGVYGEGPNEGVRGYNTDVETYGILGTDLDGIFGYCGRQGDPIGAGVYGYVDHINEFCNAHGVIAAKGADGPYAWMAGHLGDWGPGLYADGNGRAAVFQNSIQVYGGIYKTVCNFEIDHPLDPLNKVLRHTSVESPGPIVMYRGKAQLDASGEALIALPEYFVALTKEDEATITLTAIGRPFLTGYEWEGGFAAFRAYGEPDREVSWVVYADRDDPAMDQYRDLVEEEKGPGVGCPKGTLLNPIAYGYPEERGVGYEERRQQRERVRLMSTGTGSSQGGTR